MPCEFRLMVKVCVAFSFNRSRRRGEPANTSRVYLLIGRQKKVGQKKSGQPFFLSLVFLSPSDWT